MAILILLLFAISASAQSVGASLQGSVTDSSAAAIARAEVEIVNVDTGSTRALTTDGGGRWREPVLPPGDYRIRVSSPGVSDRDPQGDARGCGAGCGAGRGA